jgi:hypothetical protein
LAIDPGFGSLVKSCYSCLPPYPAGKKQAKDKLADPGRAGTKLVKTGTEKGKGGYGEAPEKSYTARK